jgi:hypothetical protein
MFHEQHAEKDILAGEEVVIADHPATTPGTMADDAAPDARKMPRLRSHEPATSYAKSRRSLGQSMFANGHLQSLRPWPCRDRSWPRAHHLLGTKTSSTFAEVVSH